MSTGTPQESLVRTYPRPPWHPSFPPKELVEETVTPEGAAKVAAWLKANEPKLPSGPELTARQKELARMSASQYVAERRAGKVSCKEYAEVLVKRMVHYKDMNQFMYWDFMPEQGNIALEQAAAFDELAEEKGVEAIAPLYGLPVPVKGTMATVDFPSSNGSGLLHRYHAKRDSSLVALLKEAHGVIMGKTNVPEFAANWVTANYANGRTFNPYGAHLTAGGSSGGSASAVATYLAPVAVTEDTGGSTRHPAFQNHNFGYDPTRNHFPNFGNPGMSYTNDQLGLTARSFDDILMMDAALLGTHAQHAARAKQPRSLAEIKVGAPVYPFVEYTPLEGGANLLPATRAPAALEAKYKAVKELLAESQVRVVDEEWPEVESATLMRPVNSLADALYGRAVNGRPVNLGGLVCCHAFSGLMQTWVQRFLEAPVSNIDLINDMMKMGYAADTGAFHKLPEEEPQESEFRYFMASAPMLVRVWNSYFDLRGVDVLVTTPQFSDALTFEEAATATVPVLADTGKGFEIQKMDMIAALLTPYLTLKNIPIPKLIVPTGLDDKGRPTAVEFWGRAPPPEKIFDDAFARTFDLDFLYTVKPLVELIQSDASLKRVDAPIVSDLFS